MEQDTFEVNEEEASNLNFDGVLNPAHFYQHDFYYVFWRLIVMKKLIQEQKDSNLKAQLIAFDECFRGMRERKATLNHKARKKQQVYDIAATVMGFLVVVCIIHEFVFRIM